MVHKLPYDIPPPKINLSDNDKQRIKQAILESVARNTSYPPDELAKLTCEAFLIIQDYKKSPTIDASGILANGVFNAERLENDKHHCAKSPSDTSHTP